MKKKLLSLLLVATLVFTLTPAAFATEGNLTQVDGVYQIEDAADLIAFSNLVNSGTTGANAVLTATIDLGNQSFTPIGTYSKPYTGTFDGAGHTIQNAEISGSDDTVIWVGLFGCVNGGTVKDFTLANIHVTNTSVASSTDSSQAASGVAVGILGTSNGGTVDSVITLSSCTVNGVYRTGGIVGSSRDRSTNISNCVNRATVTGSAKYTGGIVGAAHNVWARPSATGTRVTTCVNYGTISGTSEVGGIVGYTDRAVITSCDNLGVVTGTGNYGTGGIVGCDIYNPYLIFKPSIGSTISGCTNDGSVIAPRAGGILGSYVVSPGQNQNSSNRYSTITGCTNLGAISSQNGNGKCGAIYGAPITYKSGDADEYVNHMIAKIENCTVGGTVEGISAPESDTEFATFISPSSYVVLSGNSRYVVEE